MSGDSTDRHTKTPTQDAAQAGEGERDIEVVDVQLVLKGRRAVVLDFEGQHYTLRVTSNNKLILTK